MNLKDFLMKLFLAGILVSMIVDIEAERIKKRRKKIRTTEAPEVLENNSEEAANLIQDIEDAERESDAKYHEGERLRLQELQNSISEKKLTRPDIDVMDPCSLHHCGAGRVCELNDNGEPECVCIKECPMEVDERRKVCSNHNETWDSDCEVYRQRCMCMTGREECKNPQYKHVQVEYFGMCRTMPECTAEEMSDFPRRMRDWLFNIMRDLADRKELSEHYLTMEREAEGNLTKRWINAAVWKWCDLDANDNDRSVSRHELFPIRAPLMALEHCIAPFLNSCDSNNDHHITLLEWGKCLELEEDELEEKCDDINEANI